MRKLRNPPISAKSMALIIAFSIAWAPEFIIDGSRSNPPDGDVSASNLPN
jgi:hypothetical protein